MRICLLSVDYPPYSTEGIARQRHVLARELARQGHDVHVVICGAGHFLRFDHGVQVHEVRIDRPRQYSRRFPVLDLHLTHSQALYEGLAHLAMEKEVDVVDVPLWAAQGFVTLHRFNAPIVVWLQTTRVQLLKINRTNPSSEDGMLIAMERVCLERARGWLADSHAVMESFGTDYNVASSAPTAVAHLGLPPLAQEHTRKTMRDTVTALVVGRLEQRKGTPLMFRIVPELLRQYPQLIVRFIGRDNSSHDGWRKAHHMTYPDYFRHHYPDLAQRVFFEGYVDEVRLAAFYQSADLLIVPSMFESFGLVFLEAMRTSLPIVTFATGAALEIFDRAESSGAVLATPFDETQLAVAIGQLIQRRDLRLTVGQNGHNRFMQSFTAEIMAACTLAFYEQISLTSNAL